jgi:hypothetical protein
MMIIAQFLVVRQRCVHTRSGQATVRDHRFGQTAGAACGGLFSKFLIGRLQVHELLLVAGAILCLYLVVIFSSAAHAPLLHWRRIDDDS